MTPTTGIGKSAAYISWNPPKSLWSVKSCTRGIQFQLERVSVSKGPRNDGIQFSSLASSCSGRPAGRVNICLEPAKRRRPDHARSLDFTTTQLLRSRLRLNRNQSWFKLVRLAHDLFSA